jgi:hypothetical protein
LRLFGSALAVWFVVVVVVVMCIFSSGAIVCPFAKTRRKDVRNNATHSAIFAYIVRRSILFDCSWLSEEFGNLIARKSRI